MRALIKYFQYHRIISRLLTIGEKSMDSDVIQNVSLRMSRVDKIWLTKNMIN